MLPDVVFMAATGAFLHFTLIQNDLISFRTPAATFLDRETQREAERERGRGERSNARNAYKCSMRVAD